MDFRRILFSLISPEWDWIQIEVTSDCSAACIYCPRTVYRDRWANRYLPLETFRKIVPAFSETRYVHLQGWGEPFLHPHLFDMVAFAKGAGCRVGTTTNGMLLSREKTERIVESGVDIIAFSLAGTGEENDRIRKGTRLAKVLEAMRTLNEEKERRRRKTPAIHVAYMLFQSGLRNLRDLPELLRGCGAADAVISFLDFIPCEELKSEVISPAGKEEYEELRSLLEEVREEGSQHHLSVHHPLESMGENKQGCTRNGHECTENVQRAVCIASDGSVTPCVYTNLRVSGASYVSMEGKREYKRMVFGDIQEKSLKTIWHEKAYSAFRHSFRKKAFSPACLACPKLRRG